MSYLGYICAKLLGNAYPMVSILYQILYFYVLGIFLVKVTCFEPISDILGLSQLLRDSKHASSLYLRCLIEEAIARRFMHQKKSATAPLPVPPSCDPSGGDSLSESTTVPGLLHLVLLILIHFIDVPKGKCTCTSHPLLPRLFRVVICPLRYVRSPCLFLLVVSVVGLFWMHYGFIAEASYG